MDVNSIKIIYPGALVSIVVSVAAMFLSEHYGAPVMLMALLLGMAMNFLSEDSRYKAGLEFTAKHVLRTGVALLGLRITIEQMTAVGWVPLAIIVVSVAMTIGLGMGLAKLMGFKTFFGLLTGGAVAICGASAALAISAAMPSHPLKERATLFTVIGVSSLSTIAMMLYPMAAQYLDLSPIQIGYFLGGTIHDVAQVVGAGYSISSQVGDTATLIKLIRVAMLLPVIALTGWLAHRYIMSEGENTNGSIRPPLLPGFAVAFLFFVALHSTGWLSTWVVDAGQQTSQWFLIFAMSAIGIKTHLKQIASVGWKPVALMVIETLFLAGFFYKLVIALTP
jgi:uncharacterized integral membrane protein (TIGR00698 family)